jgi:hypothetical protein
VIYSSGSVEISNSKTRSEENKPFELDLERLFISRRKETYQKCWDICQVFHPVSPTETQYCNICWVLREVLQLELLCKAVWGINEDQNFTNSQFEINSCF